MARKSASELVARVLCGDGLQGSHSAGLYNEIVRESRIRQRTLKVNGKLDRL